MTLALQDFAPGECLPEHPDDVPEAMESVDTLSELSFPAGVEGLGAENTDPEKMMLEDMSAKDKRLKAIAMSLTSAQSHVADLALVAAPASHGQPEEPLETEGVGAEMPAPKVSRGGVDKARPVATPLRSAPVPLKANNDEKLQDMAANLKRAIDGSKKTLLPDFVTCNAFSRLQFCFLIF